MPKKVLSFLFVISFFLITSFSSAHSQDCEIKQTSCYVSNVTIEHSNNNGNKKTNKSEKLPGSYGLKTLLLIILLLLIITKLTNPKPQRDRFLLDLESWIKNHKDKRISDYVEVHIENHFPDFKAWKKSQKK